MIRVFITLFLLTSFTFSDVKSTSGSIKFDIQSDNQEEMTLNETGLGIGTSPSANLHVNGNAIVPNQLFVGGSEGSSNLNISGSLGYGFQTVSDNTIIGSKSIVMADSSEGNILLTLPDASENEGITYLFKKISSENDVTITGEDGDRIDNDDTYRIMLTSGNMGYTKMIGSSGNWLLLSISGNADVPRWSPVSTPTIVWYDASDESTISAGGSDNVYQWDDKSGNDYHLIQNVAAQQPTTSLTTMNDLNVMSFQHEDNPFQVSFAPSLNNISYTFLVYQGFDGSTGSDAFFEYKNSRHTVMTDRLAGVGNVPYGQTFGTSGFLRFFKDNSNGAEIYENTVLILDSDSASYPASTFSELYIADDSTGGNEITIDFGEFIVVNEAMTDEEIERMEGYLAHKWGLVNSLPADHTYKNVPPF